MDKSKWMVRDLRDDHVSEGDTYRNKTVKNLIGLLCYSGHLPVLVSCGPVDYFDVLTLNKVYERDGDMHLSQTATVLANGDELRTLKETGEVVLTRTQGDPILKLIKEAQ